MRTWDPLSLFKYLTGAPNAHLTFTILLLANIRHMSDEGAQRPLYAGVEHGEEIYERKAFLVKFMAAAHLVCSLVDTFLEAGVI